MRSPAQPPSRLETKDGSLHKRGRGRRGRKGRRRDREKESEESREGREGGKVLYQFMHFPGITHDIIPAADRLRSGQTALFL